MKDDKRRGGGAGVKSPSKAGGAPGSMFSGGREGMQAAHAAGGALKAGQAGQGGAAARAGHPFARGPAGTAAMAAMDNRSAPSWHQQDDQVTDWLAG